MARHPLFGALATTIAAALSTALYLYISRGQEWAPHFIQLYSLTGMISGWVNAALMHLSPRRPFLQTKACAPLVLLFCLGLAATLFSVLFGSKFGFSELLLTLGIFAPTAFAGIYGRAFSLGHYQWVYSRAVIFNIALFAASLFPLLMGESYFSLCVSTGVAGLFILGSIFFDRWPEKSQDGSPIDPLATVVNPSLPALERGVWDQWTLQLYNVEQASWIIYLCSRLISFSGNTIFSYLMGSMAKKTEPGTKIKKIIVGLAVLDAAILALLLNFDNTRALIVFGSFLAWQLSLLMTLYYQSKERIFYHVIAITWIVTLVGRLYSLRGTNVHEYAINQAVVTTLSLVLLGCFVAAVRVRARK